MKIGVICEGHTDRAVITNILKGLKGFDSSQIVALRPDYSRDETDLANLPVDSFGTWSVVKEECENKQKISKFLAFEGQDIIIIHIDSAESDEFGVTKPIKNSEYSTNLRSAIVSKINEWLEGQFQEGIIYAVAIEEIEAWILTIYQKRDSSTSASPKEKLKWILSKMDIKYDQNYDNFLVISDAFSKKKNFSKEQYTKYNKSLEEFCNEVERKI